MAASSSDMFTEVGSPGTATTLSSPGHTIGGTSLTVGSTSNWPTSTGVIFAMDTVTLVNGVEVRDAGSYTEWEGVVSSSTSITGLVLRYGTDQNYPAGSTTRVYIPVSSSREDRLVEGILVAHNQDGTHASGATYPLPVITDFTNATHDHSATNKGGGISMAAAANPYKFSAYRGANVAVGTANTTIKIPYDTKAYDTGNNFDTTNNRFVAPVAGFYHFQGGFILGSATSAITLLAFKNGSEVKRPFGMTAPGAFLDGGWGSFDLQLAANDYVEMFYNITNTSINILGGANFTYFDGFLISKT